MDRPLPDIPRATIRLQLNGGFDFDAAVAVVPYLARLGASHLYLSPITCARPGSAHGYDVIDHTRLDPELGGEDGFARLHDAAERYGLGLILDFVPNHMGIGGAENPYWQDLLEWGRDSAYAHWFDIDWDPAEETLAGKLLVPFLGAEYGAVLEAGELALAFEAETGRFVVHYYEHRFPIHPRDYARILARAEDYAGLVDLAERARPLARRRRAREAEKRAAAELKAALAALAGSDESARAALEVAAASFAGTPGRPRSFLELHRLLERQSYRLAYWRTATDEINYRRFFDINDLAGLRVEDEAVFARLHTLLLRLIGEGRVSGVRLDHVDGLYDPAGYMDRLQAAAAEALGRPAGERPLYLVAEKILAPFEHLPEDWPVHGTTGYDFMAQVLGLMLDPAGERPLSRSYARLSGRPADFDMVVHGSKQQILRNNLSAEFTVIARRLARLAKRHWQTRDFTYQAIRAALADILAHFPVYRTYIAARGPSEQDRGFLGWAVRRALRSPGLIDESVYRFLHAVLLGQWQPRAGSRRGVAREVAGIARKFQQLSGPVTAKAVEDTAFYRHARLLALNEVGSDPARWGLSPSAFHHAMAERARRWPHAMLATATHDHKRGEDVRARLAVLSESPQEWAKAAARFARLNRRHRTLLEDDEPAPSPHAEYVFYQTVAGAWPPDLAPDDADALAAFAGRIEEAMIKAVREAKLKTNWAKPDEAYEAAVSGFVRAALDPSRSRAFLAAMHRLVERIAPAGAVNSLAQCALKYTCPGVPDLYQGTEFWDFSLVDPDNRRPVDFPARAAALAEAASNTPGEMLERWRDGRIKQALIGRLLDRRRRDAALFAEGAYRPLEIVGTRSENALAFERCLDGRRMLVAVPRLTAAAARGAPALGVDTDFWDDTELAADLGGLHDLLTGKPLHARTLSALFERVPLCVATG